LNLNIYKFFNRYKTAFDTGDIIELGVITASIKKVESVINDARKVPKIHHSPKNLIEKLQN